MKEQSNSSSPKRWPYLTGVVVFAVVAVIVAVAVSGAVEGGVDDRAIELVPENAAAYATIYLDPSLDQKLSAKDLVDQVGASSDEGGQSLDDLIASLVDAVSPADYENDLKPEMGDQLAAYDWPGEDPTLVAATDDPRASRLAMHRLLESEYPGSGYRIALAEHHGQPYEHVILPGVGPITGTSAFTIVDGFIVLGGERGVKESIDAWSSGDSLADAGSFSDARKGVSGDSLAFAYLDPAAFVEEPGDDEYLDPASAASIDLIRGLGPIAAAFTADDESVTLDLSTESGSGDAEPFGDASGLLRTLPADAVAALSVGDLEGPLRTWLGGSSSPLIGEARDAVAGVAGLDLERDVASWLGGAAAYVSGSDEDTVEAAVVAQTHSPPDSDAVVARVGDYYEGRYYEDEYSNYPVYGSEGGFDVSLGEDSLAVRGDEERVVVGLGAGGFSTGRALDPDGGFGDSELYGRAGDLLGGDYEPVLAVDAPRALGLLEQLSGGTGNVGASESVEDWLAELETVAAGVRTDDGRLRARLVIGVR